MSIEPLTQLYRPHRFSDVVGQESVVRLIESALNQNRLFSSWLFSGASGVGKTTVARILAASLTDVPSDILEIDAASHGSVSDVRSLREMVQYAPVGKARVLILDEAHMLSNFAFDALLKIMEETPKNVYFIFITTQEDRIPETILSRCMHIPFSEISSDQILSYLLTVSKKEQIEIEDEVLAEISLLKAPSVRSALSLLEQVDIEDSLTLEQYHAKHGQADAGFLIMAACRLGKLQKALEITRCHVSLYGNAWVLDRVSSACVEVCRIHTGAASHLSFSGVRESLAYSLSSEQAVASLEIVWNALSQSRRLGHSSLAEVIVTLLAYQLAESGVEEISLEPAADLEDFV